MASRYSAGRIFLQVVPSFKGLQREVGREVKKLNDQLDKNVGESTEKASRAAGRKAGRSFADAFGEGTLQEEAKFRLAIAKQIGRVHADAAKAEQDHRDRLDSIVANSMANQLREGEKARKVREAQAAKDEAAAQAHWDRMGRIQEKAQIENARREDARLRTRGGAARAEMEKTVKSIERTLGDIDISTPFGRELDRMKRVAQKTSKDISAGIINPEQGINNIRRLGRELEKLGKSRGIDNATKGNIRQATRDIENMGRAVDSLGSKGGLMSRWLRGTTGDANDGANAFRIFNYRVLAVTASLPLLVPLLGAAAGGLVALSNAAVGAGAALGVMVLGFSGVGDAVKALGDVQSNAAKDTLAATKTMRNAARGVRDAQQGLDRARQQAARSAEDSNRRIADAEERLADAQRDATEAQEGLREARRQAQQDQEDLADKIKAGQLDERQALIDLFNAQVAYNAAMADGGATNLEREQAAIDLERARLGIKNIREENAALAKEQAQQNRQGIEGDRNVVRARQGAADAEKRVADARRDVADAQREAGQQAADSAIAIRDAQERLGDAQESYNEALQKTGDIGSASMQKLEEAMGKLSPAGQGFARYLFSLRDTFYELRNAAQEGMLPGVQKAMENIISRYGPGFLRFVGSMAAVLGTLFVKASEVFQNPVWSDFFAMMEANAGIFTEQFADVFLNLLTGMAALMTAFAPVSKDFGDALVDISGAFADWAASLKDSDGLTKFFGWLETTGPKIWELIMAIGGAFVNLGIALAPIADKLLDFAIDFFDTIANMDPETLSAIVTAILGFVLASQLAAGATQLWLTFSTPFHSVLGAMVFAVVALATGFIWLYHHSDTFREVIDKIVGFIKKHQGVFLVLGTVVAAIGSAFFVAMKVMTPFFGVMGSLERIVGFVGRAFKLARVALLAFSGPIGWIILGIGLLVAGLIWAYKNVDWFRDGVNAVFGFIGKVISAWWEYYVKPVFGFVWAVIKNVGAVLWWLLNDVGGPVFELLGAIVMKLWEKAIQPAIDGAIVIFGWLGDKISEVWGWVEPILDKFGLGADDLKNAWQVAIGLIGDAWEGLKSLVYEPIKFIVDTVINKGFVDNFNKLADFFGTSKIPHLSLPMFDTKADSANQRLSNGGRSTKGGSFATGGYTGPGSKYQPAGIVHADEYVIRKESTNRLRSKYGLATLDYINRYGEIPGMGYATGGLVAFGKKLQSLGFNVGEHPAFGGVSPVHTKNSWHYRKGAIDVNYDGHGQAFETQKINSILGLARQYGMRIIWQTDGHYDHAHFDIGNGADIGNFSGASEGRGAPWYIEKPLGFIRDAINGLTAKLGDDPFSTFLGKVPLKILDMASERILSIVEGNAGDKDNGALTGKNNPIGGAMQWRDLVLGALARVGQSSSLVDIVLGRMNKESSGDPRAINLWDVNAKNGTPSKGLMQLIDPTFAAYRDKGLPNDIWNPMSNVVASMRYALGRYGSLPAAYNRAGGYAEGGLVGGVPDNGTMMYDNGGYLPPGITQVVNLTGRPEPVFTADQFEGMKGGRGGALVEHLDVDLNGTDVTPGDVVREILYGLTRASHGGKYEGMTD